MLCRWSCFDQEFPDTSIRVSAIILKMSIVLKSLESNMRLLATRNDHAILCCSKRSIIFLTSKEMFFLKLELRWTLNVISSCTLSCFFDYSRIDLLRQRGSIVFSANDFHYLNGAKIAFRYVWCNWIGFTQKKSRQLENCLFITK